MKCPNVRAFFDESTNTFSYVVWDPEQRKAAVVDSVLDYDPASGRTGHISADAIVAFVETSCLRVEWLIETHVHADHLSAVRCLQSRIGGKIGISEHIVSVQSTFAQLFNFG